MWRAFARRQRRSPASTFPSGTGNDCPNRPAVPQGLKRRRWPGGSCVRRRKVSPEGQVFKIKSPRARRQGKTEIPYRCSKGEKISTLHRAQNARRRFRGSRKRGPPRPEGSFEKVRAAGNFVKQKGGNFQRSCQLGIFRDHSRNQGGPAPLGTLKDPRLGRTKLRDPGGNCRVGRR